MRKLKQTSKAWLMAALALLALAFSASAQTTNVWTDNFESPSVWDNWSVDNGVWEIGAPTTGPATNSLGYRTHEGTNCAATVLAGNYPASTSSRLIRMMPFVVPSASQNPRLEFWHWYQFSGNSYGVVQIKYGTNNWADLSPRYYANSMAWTRPVVDLKAYAGKAIQVAFQIVADGSVNDGWDVDEVRVIKGPYKMLAENVTEGFELGIGDWSAETGIWEVGVPTSGPPTNALGWRAYSGTNCAATVLDGNYTEDRSSRLVSPPFVVPTADQNPRLRFWHWWSIGTHDWAQVQIKVGTNTWQALSGRYDTDSSGRWSRGWLDLSSYAAQTVQLGFWLESHTAWPYSSTVGAGWYLDEVMVETGPPPPPNSPEGFESGWGGWRADYFGGQATDFAVWEFGVPASGPPTNATGHRAFAGTNCAATVLNGNYPASRESRLISPTLVVPAANQNPRLEFWHWYQFSGNSYGVVEIKVGTNAWLEVSPRYYGDSMVWTRPVVPLTQYAGQSVQIGFRFASDGNLAPGWFVDEFQIVTGAYQTLVPNVIEGFELGLGDWFADTGIWEVGVPTSGPPTNAAGWRAHEPTNCAATVLAGNYTEDRSSRLISPPFVLPSVGEHPTLRFWHWFAIGTHDFCQVQVRAGTNAWQNLSAQYAGSSGVWSRPSLDLSALAGQTVQLGFWLESHTAWPYSSTVGAGWYVDEVMVTSVTPATGIVEFTDARYFVNEGGGSATISVARRYGSAGAASVTFMATDGSAVGGDDFDSVVDTLSWADGEQGVKTITVPITPDSACEPNETVSLELIVPGSLASVVARTSATLVIVDDDCPPISTNIAYLRSLVVPTNYVATNTSLFTVEGTVTTHANLSTAAANELFFIQDNTNGIAVHWIGGTNQFMPQAGDRVRVCAALTNINGLLALAPNYANITNYVWRLSTSNVLPVPAALDFASRTDVPVMEATEARYLSAAQVIIDQTGGGTLPTVLTDLTMTNLSGQTFSLTIHPNTDLAGKPKPAGPVTILGVLNQNDSTAPYTTNYALLPTRYADIITAPTITAHPQSRTNGVGTTATFTVTAVGTEPLYYQWRKSAVNLSNGGNVSGATSNVLALANVQPADATNYSVIVTNYLGAATSSVATLTVVVPVSITTQPQSQTVDAGTDVMFGVEASGSPPFTYQWYGNDYPIPNATNNVFTLHQVTTNWSGTFHVVVDNAAHLPAVSSNAILTVNPTLIGVFIPEGLGFGSFTKTNNLYTVTGGGEDIEGTEDRFYFLSMPWTGDGELIARVKNLIPADPQSEAGLMFRHGMVGGDRHVFLAMDAGENVVFRRRLAENTYSIENTRHGTNDVWLKLARMGDTFIGHYSTNGVSWELVWWTTQPNLPATLSAGLAVTAHRNGSYATADFDLVGPRGLTPLPGAWSESGPRIWIPREPTTCPPMSQFGGYKMLICGSVGDAFTVKAATNLGAPFSTWLPIGTLTNAYGVVPFTDTQAMTHQQRFYRLEKLGL